MTEVRSYSVPHDKHDLITKFDKLDGSHASNVLRAIDLYMKHQGLIKLYSPQVFDPIETWVQFIHEMDKGKIKKFGKRFDQINRIFEDVND